MDLFAVDMFNGVGRCLCFACLVVWLLAFMVGLVVHVCAGFGLELFAFRRWLSELMLVFYCSMLACWLGFRAVDLFDLVLVYVWISGWAYGWLFGFG